MAILCPVAGKPGMRVPTETVRNMLHYDRLPDVDGREWYYCDLPDCDVVYFAGDGKALLKSDLRVRVGAKEKVAPRPVCYCFGHTVETIREEIERTGASSVRASITARVKAGECSCETLNPKGRCCLGDINTAVQETFATLGRNPPGQASTGSVEPHDCCADRRTDPPVDGAPPRVERAGLLSAGASVLAAVAASACCWLPLLLVAFGASAAGASAAFERARPFLLVLAPLFLGFGFYSVYFRKETCTLGSACASAGRKKNRFNRAMLWIATGVVLLVAFFPNYVGMLLRDAPAASSGMDGPTTTLALRIDGMTCETCAIHVERELAAVPGVRRVIVSYADGRATVTLDATHPPDAGSLRAAIGKAGYRGQIVERQ